ncbi:unnamed protein product [Dovyalis caffra]|uniref:Uncharacterized protein n=1 Tax=Dovyalis caffra TaxID=77055 RepID=A0AAV1RPG0_9ROSI|nr:unnamed protein product [Dovyalis caffra]
MADALRYDEDVEYMEDSHSKGIRMMHMSRNSNLQNGNDHSHHMNVNRHVALNVNSENKIDQGHVKSSHCSQNHQGKPKTESAPLGSGGLDLGRNSARKLQFCMYKLMEMLGILTQKAD